MPLVSVVIPTYNRADLLPDTLACVLGQSLDDLEAIVVDDGSTDHTQEVMAEVRDPRVRSIRNPWSGHPSVGRNTGIRAATGKYLAFVDSDDLWLPDKLRRQVEFLEADPGRHWCFTHYDNLAHQSGETVPRPIPRPLARGAYRPADLLCGNFVGSPTVLVRRELLERTGPFDENPALRFVEDWELWLRLSAVTPGGFLPEPLALYRLHPGAATHEPEPLANALRCLAAINAAVTANPETYQRHYQRAVGTMLPVMVKRLLFLGQRDNARQVCDAAAPSPAGAPGLFALSLLSRLPEPAIRAGLAVNRKAKSLLGR